VRQENDTLGTIFIFATALADFYEQFYGHTQKDSGHNAANFVTMFGLQPYEIRSTFF